MEAMTADPLHVYIESLPAPAGFENIVGYKQVTDAYLLALARRNEAIFLTFDARLKHLAGAQTKIKILGA